MDRQGGPQPELRLRKMHRPSDRREQQKRDRVQNEDSSERDSHLLLVRLKNWSHCRDGAASANRGPEADE